MKKLLILFVLVTIFSCSDDEKPEPEQEQEPLVTKVNLRIEDENGLTFSDIQGTFLKMELKCQCLIILHGKMF